MATADILLDAYDRIREEVAGVLDGIDPQALVWQPDPGSNTIAWLIWHLTRVQDDHLAAAFGREQVWREQGWTERFGLPFPPQATGYGHSPEEVALVRCDAGLLGAYHEAVAGRSADLLRGITDGDLDRVVDERWDPPVTLGVRLVSVLSDDLQHVGQAAYVKGLAARVGSGLL